VEWAQEIGLQDTNSLFFVPEQQAITRMTLSFTQPLLRHGGCACNESQILLAEIETSRAHYELAGELQEHAFEVIRAYWDLYLQRAYYLQRQRAHRQAVQILDELKARENIDSLRSQVARARAAVAVRRAAVQRAELGTRSAQARILTLTNDPEWLGNQALELTPADPPLAAAASADLQSAFETALMHRHELAATTQRVHEAQVRLGISRNELLPTLNLVVESYVAGLKGEYDVATSFGNQFNEGAPSYGAGLIFQVPWGNRQAKAELRRRDFELAQLSHELKALLARVALDVEVAINDLEATQREMRGRYEALLATDEEVKYLQERWRMFPGEDRAVSFVLEELLDAQDRQMEAEASFVRAQVEYTLAHYALQRATGTLLHLDGDHPAVPGIPEYFQN
jgi:outer membrane protein TolC